MLMHSEAVNCLISTKLLLKHFSMGKIGENRRNHHHLELFAIFYWLREHFAISTTPKNGYSFKSMFFFLNLIRLLIIVNKESLVSLIDIHIIHKKALRLKWPHVPIQSKRKAFRARFYLRRKKKECIMQYVRIYWYIWDICLIIIIR